MDQYRCWSYLISCFPHVVNLLCKGVLSTITNMDYAADDAEDFVPSGLIPTNLMSAINHNPIATIRTLVQVVRTFYEILFDISLISLCHADTCFWSLSPVLFWSNAGFEDERSSTATRHGCLLVIHFADGWTCHSSAWGVMFSFLCMPKVFINGTCSTGYCRFLASNDMEELWRYQWMGCTQRISENSQGPSI